MLTHVSQACVHTPIGSSAAEKEARAKIPPAEMFLGLTELYSKFDSEGLPTHDKDGEALSKGATKKLMKEYAKQRELHEKYLASS